MALLRNAHKKRSKTDTRKMDWLPPPSLYEAVTVITLIHPHRRNAKRMQWWQEVQNSDMKNGYIKKGTNTYQLRNKTRGHVQESCDKQKNYQSWKKWTTLHHKSPLKRWSESRHIFVCGSAIAKDVKEYVWSVMFTTKWGHAEQSAKHHFRPVT